MIVTLLLLVVVLPVSVYVVVSTPWAQEKIRAVAESELSQVLGSQVNIGRVEYHPFNTLQLESISVADDKGHTALSIAKVAARFELWHFLRSRKFIFDYALVDGLDVRLYRQSVAAPLNVAGIIDRFRPKEPKQQPKEFELRISTILIRNAHLSYDVLDRPDTPGRFNANHLDVSDLQLYAYLRNASPHGADVQVEELSLREQSGFELTALSTDAVVTDSLIDLRELRIALPQSQVELQPLSLRINGFSDIVPAARAATLRLATASEATISTADLTAFVPAFEQLQRTVSARFAITSANDVITVDTLEIGDSFGSSISLQASVNQPFESDSLQLHVNQLDATLTASDLRSVSALLPRKAATYISRLGGVHVAAVGSGNVRQADARATVYAAGATITVNGHAASANRFRTFTFDVSTTVDRLPAGTLLSVPDLGAVTAAIDADGTYAGKATAANVSAVVSNLTYRGYTYSAINLDVALSALHSPLSASITSDDPNAAFDLNLALSALHTPLSATIALDLSRLDLNALQLSQKYPGYALSGALDVNAAMHDTDHIYGEVTARNLDLRDADRNGISMRSFELSVQPLTTDSLSTAITIASDYLNGSITGEITPSTLAATFQDMAAHVAPNLIPHDEERHQRVTTSHNLFDIDLTLSNAEELSDFLHLPVRLIYPVDIRGSVDGANGQAVISIDAPYLQQGDNIIDSTVLAATINAPANTATVYATTHTPTKKGPMNVVLGVSGSNSTFRTAIDWEIERAVPINGTINFSTALSRSEAGSMCVSTDFHPGQINFGDEIWHINPSNVTWCDNTLSVTDFAMHTESQAITISGVGSASIDDVMYVD
ncbi:MAG: hypothetical protein ACI4AM_08565, partial [Muribaculaceae bacterium]